MVYATQPQVDELVLATDKLRKNYSKKGGVHVIWAVHWPPVDRGPLDFGNKIDGFKLIIDAAIANNVQIILSGHTHEPTEFLPYKNGQIWVAGSASQHGQSHWLHEMGIEIQGVDLVRAVRRNYLRKGGLSLDYTAGKAIQDWDAMVSDSKWYP